MLTNTELKILNIFKNIYELKTTNSINENLPYKNIRFDKEHIPTILLNKFFNKTKNFIPNILEYSLTYSLLYNISLKNIFLNKDINNIDSLDEDIKRNILYSSIKYIINKQDNKIKKEEIDNIKENNLKLFYNITGFYYTKTINQYIKTIINNLTKELKTELNPIILEKIFFSNEYDDLIKKVSKNFITNDKEIKIFKLYLLRILLYEIYVLEQFYKNQTIKNNPSMIPFKNNISSYEIEFIKECINKNHFCLPQDKSLRNSLLNKFSNFINMDKSEALRNVEKEHKHELKKIYPLYILDKFE